MHKFNSIESDYRGGEAGSGKNTCSTGSALRGTPQTKNWADASQKSTKPTSSEAVSFFFYTNAASLRIKNS